MVKKGKKYTEARNAVDAKTNYGLDDAIRLIEETKTAKFDETVEVAVTLGIDPRQANQQIRTGMILPHGIGKDIRVIVFAKDDKQREASDAGADYAGLDDLMEKISKENWLEFDVSIATPDVMNIVAKLGKVLGPRGLMPSPKVGTVTFDVAKAVKEAKAGRIEVKNDKGGVVHAPIGKVSFGTGKLKDNFLVFMDSLLKMKPPSSKGVFVRKITLSNTMGPGIKVDFISVRDELKTAQIAA
ncbi:MAG: 50S ribosomal protein L1 [Candidatus Dadabacteria bacterium RIFCSPHIGHO2_12_FULL_53_21]|nr:MAG: 50S ribosomal protein L1 [Candidatus Dadabacteria bacterium RIFCSPHIGHO2_12_FULL_53_21]